jgi:hypothetical protein
MILSDAEITKLRDLEESLWKADYRWNKAHQEKVFAPDFFEFGRSGKIYSRHDLIKTEYHLIKAVLPLPKFKIHMIDESNVLITYESVVQHEGIEKANRSSIWSRAGSEWQLRFHQGTPIP